MILIITSIRQLDNQERVLRDTDGRLLATQASLKKIELEHAKLQANHHQLKKEFHLVRLFSTYYLLLDRFYISYHDKHITH